MHDPLLVGVARPGDVGLALGEGRAERVHAGDELAVVTEHVERSLAGAVIVRMLTATYGESVISTPM